MIHYMKTKVLNKNNQPDLSILFGLAFFLGSLLYPKVMISQQKEAINKQETKSIYAYFYKFSIGNLDRLLEWIPFQVLITHFALNYDIGKLQGAPCVKTQPQDLH